jgi:hypothetical protein
VPLPIANSTVKEKAQRVFINSPPPTTLLSHQKERASLMPKEKPRRFSALVELIRIVGYGERLLSVGDCLQKERQKSLIHLFDAQPRKM